MATDDQDLIEKLRLLDLEKEELDVNISAYESSRESNERLRMEVYEARNQAAIELSGAEREKEKIRALTLKLRLELQAYKEKILLDADEEYQMKATNDLRGGAEEAQANNKRIKVALEERTKDASEVLRDQRNQASKLRDSIVERDLLTDTITKQDERLEKVAKSADKAQCLVACRQADVTKIQTACQKAQRVNAGIKAAIRQIEDHSKTLDELQATTKMRQFQAVSRAKHLIKQHSASSLPPRQEHVSQLFDETEKRGGMTQRYSEEELQRMWMASRQCIPAGM